MKSTDMFLRRGLRERFWNFSNECDETSVNARGGSTWAMYNQNQNQQRPMGEKHFQPKQDYMSIYANISDSMETRCTFVLNN